jgi:hypothetical protein
LLEVALGPTPVILAAVEIGLGHDAKGADGGGQARFHAVDLVHAIAVSYWPALQAAGAKFRNQSLADFGWRWVLKVRAEIKFDQTALRYR